MRITITNTSGDDSDESGFSPLRGQIVLKYSAANIVEECLKRFINAS